MSDIDFDELDRAVAAVLSSDDKKTPESADASTPAAPAVLSAAPVSSPAPVAETSTPVSVNVAPKVETRADPTPTPAAPVAPQATVSESVPVRTPIPADSLHADPVKPVSRGQFLDMVGPARPAPRPSAAPSPASQAPAVPVATRTNGAFVSDIIAAPAPKIEPTPTPAPSAIPEPNPVAPVEEPTDFFAASPDDASPHKAPETVASPFIPDAKVEKRPLGAFSIGDNGAPLPTGDELHQQLVNVESDDHIASVDEPVGDAPRTIQSSAFGASSATTVETKPDKKQKKVKDVTPKPRAEKVPKYGKGTLIWVSVAVVVMLIGFGVGASLYFFVIK